MTRFDTLNACGLAILLFAVAGCSSGRQLVSVSLTPASADANNFPGSQVQFTATGRFSQPPSPTTVASPQIFWCIGGQVSGASPATGVCAGNIAQFASVDQTGLAQCTSSPPGPTTTYILAGTPQKSANPDIGPTLKVFGSAQLTCP